MIFFQVAILISACTCIRVDPDTLPSIEVLLVPPKHPFPQIQAQISKVRSKREKQQSQTKASIDNSFSQTLHQFPSSLELNRSQWFNRECENCNSWVWYHRLCEIRPGILRRWISNIWLSTYDEPQIRMSGVRILLQQPTWRGWENSVAARDQRNRRDWKINQRFRWEVHNEVFPDPATDIIRANIQRHRASDKCQGWVIRNGR